MSNIKENLILAGLATVAATGAMLLASPEASAVQHDDVLCSSNMAYRSMPAHKDYCSFIAVNSHGHGGAYDADGDGTPADDDANDHDPKVQ